MNPSIGRSKSAIVSSRASWTSIPGPDFDRHIGELQQIAAGIALVGEISERIRARVMATGELLATVLGAQFLRSQGLEVTWIDARTVLKAESAPGRRPRQRVCRRPAVSSPIRSCSSGSRRPGRCS